MLLVGVVFFITTQREAVNWVVGGATAATAAIPVMMRALEFPAGRASRAADRVSAVDETASNTGGRNGVHF
ncbi:MAG TPA: hypothetical protein VL049_29490 [Candidatus Dormibacteraeota bacterium]|nr:hypothetical protein [Candidatus Dormibacteraeota bacterium]